MVHPLAEQLSLAAAELILRCTLLDELLLNQLLLEELLLPLLLPVWAVPLRTACHQ